MKHRSIYTSLIYLVAVFSLLSCANKREPITVTVMSYNIGYGQNGIENVASVIRDVDPDVVGLQEVDVHWSKRSDFIDQAEYLASALGMHLFYAPIYSLPDSVENGRPRKFGLAFLSKYPFIETINHPLSRLSTQDTVSSTSILPGFPQVTVKIGNSLVTLFNTHLDFRRDPRVREIQVEEMLSIIEMVDHPKILLGDFNAQPDADVLKPIFGLFTNAVADDPTLLYTFPSDNASRQIDYITFSSHFTLDTVYVVQSLASDHLPIIARLRINAD